MKQCLIIAICWSAVLCHAQQYDNHWYFGYDSNTMDSTFGGSVIFFGDTLPQIDYEFREMNFSFTNLTMSDSSGDLLFSTNGIYIADQNNDPMENGHNINPGPFADEFRDLGYNLPHGMVACHCPIQRIRSFIFFMSAWIMMTTGGRGQRTSCTPLSTSKPTTGVCPRTRFLRITLLSDTGGFSSLIPII